MIANNRWQNPNCIMQKAALLDQKKILYSLVSWDIVKRKLNTSEEEPQSVKRWYFGKNMERSGYDKRWKVEIFGRGLKGYGRLRELDKLGKRKLHMRGKDTLLCRFRQKLTGNQDWYKQGKKKTDWEWKSPEKKNRKKPTRPICSNVCTTDSER